MRVCISVCVYVYVEKEKRFFCWGLKPEPTGTSSLRLCTKDCLLCVCVCHKMLCLAAMLGEDEEEPTGVIHLFNVEMTLHLKPCIKRAAEETESASGEVEIFTLVMA